ncbi:MAG: iron-containing alcohol dehydrogenase [Chloroflexota bacterium]
MSGPGSPIGAFALGRLPRITFGAGSFDKLPAIVAANGRRALLVRGGSSLERSGRLAALRAGLAAAGVELAGEATVSGEPSPAVVDAIAAAHRGRGVDVVLGVGGGSVLDTAKAVSGLLLVDAPVTDFLEGLPGARPWPGPSVPLVAVPTTAGTGSEATRNAVISERGPDGYKRSFRDERLVPADAVVDPALLAGLSADAIAANGMDAVTQLLESYVSLRAGAVTDALALAGLEAARDSLVAWHAAPDGPDAPLARERMAWAALLSGICLANAGLGGVHGLASPLGAQFPVPHGAACGATLAMVTAANGRRRGPRAGLPALPRYAVLGRLLARMPEATLDEEAARARGHAARVVGRGADARPRRLGRDRGRHPGAGRRRTRQFDAYEPGRPHRRGAGRDPARGPLAQSPRRLGSRAHPYRAGQPIRSSSSSSSASSSSSSSQVRDARRSCEANHDELSGDGDAQRHAVRVDSEPSTAGSRQVAASRWRAPRPTGRRPGRTRRRCGAGRRPRP